MKLVSTRRAAAMRTAVSSPSSCSRRTPTRVSALERTLLITFVAMSQLLSHVTIAQQSRPIRGMQMHELNASVFRLTIDSRNGDIFVGARNWIYKLNKADLTIVDSVSTGPHNDSAICKPYPLPCTARREVTPNDNQVLLIKYDTRPEPLVISCGTTDQGMCHIHKISRLDFGGPRLFGSPNDTINYISSRSGTVAFFAPATSGQATNGKTVPQYMYIASEYDGRPLDLSPPMVSSKQLSVKESATFKFATQTPGMVSKFDFHPNVKQMYSVKYLYGFHHGRYAYFLTTQPVGLRSADYETRLARICLDDPTFFSYSETPIYCEGKEIDLHFNLATTGYLGKLGDNQMSSLGLSSSSSTAVDALFVAFASTVQGQGRTINKERGSLVCAFLMKKIDETFEKAVKDCFNGKARIKLLAAAYGEPRSCTKTTYEPEDLCGSGRNSYIEGNIPLAGNVLVEFPKTNLTALAVTVQSKETVGVVGTDEGEFIKVLLKDGTQLFKYRIAVSSDDDKEVRASPVFDPSEKFLYLASGKTVVRFPVGSCSIYTDCSSCLENKDPLKCGWCGGKCGHVDECGGEPNRLECSPELLDFNPAKGPTAGGTEVTIYGDNFGAENQGENSVINVTVAGIPCDISRRDKREIKCTTRSSNTKDVSGKINVFVRDVSRVAGTYDINGNVESNEEFFYLEPSIESISPTYGPEAGGSKLYVKGKNLDIGKNRKVTVNGVTCAEKANNGTVLTCITGKANYPRSPAGLSVQIDTVELTLPPTQPIFVYKSDPDIFDFEPHATISSGGTTVTVNGRHLDSVADPKMIVSFTSTVTQEKMVRNSSCTISTDGESMVCAVPGLPTDSGSSISKLSGKQTFQAIVSFELDGAYRTVDRPMLIYYPNPVFSHFENSKSVVMYEDPVIELSGNNVHGDYDVKVLVGGNRTCNVQPQSVYNKLSCKLDFNGSQLPSEDELLPVQVVVGNLTFDLGYAAFAHSPPEESSTTFVVVIIVFVTLALVGIFIFFVMQRGGFTKKRPESFNVAYTPNAQGNDYPERHLSNGKYLACFGYAFGDRCPPPHCPPPTLDYSQGSSGQRSDMDQLRTPLIPGARGPYVMDDETLAILTSEHKLIAHDYLTLGETVGKGHFGCVFKASLRLPGTDEYTQVAVKTLQSSWVSSHDVEMFIKEALIMKDFDHEHVLNLIGVSFSPIDGSPLVIIPFMPNGDLLTFIRDVHNQPSNKQLISFGIEIAKGMDYLATQKFVHRDLAARNCILDSNLRVKVADFGLSRDVYEREYYKSESKTELPVKWMAPESLDKGSYNIKTDVWAFGVTLWEVMTRGAFPYHLVANWQMLEYLKLGYRLPQPEHCPDILFSIMYSCWSMDSNNRPTFSDLVTGVQDVISILKEEAMQRRISLNITYVNLPETNSSQFANQYYNQFEVDRPSTSKDPMTSQV